MNSTTNYDVFKFRDDNRTKIRKRHVEALVESIQRNNQLEKHPIVVNQDMEVINGQHRLCAAKELGVPIYYIVQEKFTPEDLYISNLSMQWGLSDYFNFYLKRGEKEYIALQKFMKATSAPLSQAIQIASKEALYTTFRKFKNGDYVFELNISQDLVSLVRETIETLKNVHEVNGKFLSTCKFWLACLYLFQQDDFNVERWRQAIHLYGYRVSLRATKKEFIQMLGGIYNYKLSAMTKLYTGVRD